MSLFKAIRAAWREFWRELAIQQRRDAIKHMPDPWL